MGKTSYSPRAKSAKGELSVHPPVHTKRRTRRRAEANVSDQGILPDILSNPKSGTSSTVLLVLVLLIVLYLRVPIGNTEDPAQTSLRSVSVLILDLRSSLPRELLLELCTAHE